MPAISVGAIDVVVPNVADRFGSLFVPRGFVFYGAATKDSFETYAAIMHGLDDGAGYRGVAGFDEATIGVKVCDGFSWPIYSVARIAANFFPPSIGTVRVGYVSAVAVGSFTLHLLANGATGDSILYTAFGGDALSLEMFPWGHVPAPAPGDPWVIPTLAASKGIQCLTVPGTGGFGPSANIVAGWAARDSGLGALSISSANLNESVRYVSTNELSAEVTAAPVPTLAARANVAAWNDAGITLGGVNGTAQSSQFLVFEGDGVLCAAGAFQVPATPGAFTFNATIAAENIQFMSAGSATPGVIDATQAGMSYGTFDGANQGGFWTGETAQIAPPTGARTIREPLITIATPALGASAITTRISGVSIDRGTGVVTLDAELIDGTQPWVLWFAVGTELVVPPPTPPTSNPMCLVPLPAPVLTR